MNVFAPTMSRGTSDAALEVEKAANQGRRELQGKSIMLGLGSAVFEELAAVAEECGRGDWDGHDAMPVTKDAYDNAFRFLEALPLGTPAPSVGAEPDGHLTLEWHRSGRRTLSVSISPEDDVHYSALFGPGTGYGTEPFFGDVPAAILDLIHRVDAR
jgi:hypothetical protein